MLKNNIDTSSFVFVVEKKDPSFYHRSSFGRQEKNNVLKADLLDIIQGTGAHHVTMY